MSDLAARVAALVDRLHKPGYPSAVVPDVTRLSNEVAQLVAEHTRCEAERGAQAAEAQRLAGVLEAERAEAAMREARLREEAATAALRATEWVLGVIDALGIPRARNLLALIRAKLTETA